MSPFATIVTTILLGSVGVSATLPNLRSTSIRSPSSEASIATSAADAESDALKAWVSAAKAAQALQAQADLLEKEAKRYQRLADSAGAAHDAAIRAFLLASKAGVGQAIVSAAQTAVERARDTDEIATALFGEATDRYAALAVRCQGAVEDLKVKKERLEKLRGGSPSAD